ncbi:MAG: DUF116 domain-containing protein [Sporomusaceae bacterium]|nr:DUF116 domain-containing protein [Sporomusaceae bacterium]
MLEVVSRPQKRLFLALLLVSLIIAACSIYGIWKVSLPGLSALNELLPWFIGTILGLFVLTVFAGVGGIILAILGFPTPRFFQGVAWSAVQLLFPIAIAIGKLFDVDKERVERSFIEVSNHLIRKRQVIVKPNRFLILTPHCIQQEDCPYKVTKNIENCRRCGRCQVGELAAVAEKYEVHLAIVTGGTLARRVVKALKPQAILAIACERDLTTGIQDVFPLPVVGLLNERPCGPCCNTRVDMAAVEKIVRQFLGMEEIEEKEEKQAEECK